MTLTFGIISPVRKLYAAKELFMFLLAIISMSLVIIELRYDFSKDVLQHLHYFDTVVALLFLSELVIEWSVAKNRQKYFRKNWWYVFAAIPVSYQFTETLRGLRLFRIFRFLRAGEHLGFEFRK